MQMGRYANVSIMFLDNPRAAKIFPDARRKALFLWRKAKLVQQEMGPACHRPGKRRAGARLVQHDPTRPETKSVDASSA